MKHSDKEAETMQQRSRALAQTGFVVCLRQRNRGKVTEWVVLVSVRGTIKTVYVATVHRTHTLTIRPAFNLGCVHGLLLFVQTSLPLV